jgi:hypothetical protein
MNWAEKDPETVAACKEQAEIERAKRERIRSRIRSLHAEGHSTASIANAVGMHKSSVKDHMKAMGLKSNGWGTYNDL